MKEYKVIKNLSDEKLASAYKEMKAGELPSGNKSIVRTLQGELYREVGKTVPLTSIMYHVAMEMLDRLLYSKMIKG